MSFPLCDILENQGIHQWLPNAVGFQDGLITTRHHEGIPWGAMLAVLNLDYGSDYYMTA